MTPLQLTDVVRQTSYDIHRYFGHGHFEKVYENALAHRLRKAGYRVDSQFSITVCDADGFEVGQYFADLLVEGYLIVELKTVGALNRNHEGQILGYLRATRMEHGMLINFGAPRFDCQKLAL